MGEFVAGLEPEFEGAVESAVRGEGDARDPASEGFGKFGFIFGRGGGFESAGSLAKRPWQIRTPEQGGNGLEVGAVLGFGRGHF